MSETGAGPSSAERVVFIDDEAEVCRANRQSLELDGYRVETFGAAAPALTAILADPPGLVITDVRLPDLDGNALFARLRAIDPELPVILITGHGDIRMAVAAMRDGAYDFLAKPYPAEALLASARRALDRRRLVLENRRLRARLDAALEEDPAFLGVSPEIVRLRKLVREVAQADVDVLVFGETGSGKEVVASALHRWGRRAKRNFVAMNCGALPDSVVESELFGHEAGAFTGALKRRVGRIEHAQGGTLFLDEIESMPLGLQVKILRVLQERVVEPLGSNDILPIDMRVVAATKVDLGQAAAQGTFRDDLYHRLNVITIAIPPLRDRREDVMLLFQEFLRRAAARFKREVPAVSAHAMDHLRRHDWPGNVRELGHFAERYALGLGQTDFSAPEPVAAGTLAEQVDRFERGLIREELIVAAGDVRLAAESLGTPRKTLYDKIARHGLTPTDYR
ncbi:sigma-54-dependent transcriptional regulator [Methylobacterium goesingense]|uniref:Two-component system C4-dicarboxylate transport response regulator DctD n=1 Tax=Methylobacterium goesingense TaxID=243690 RepID=A0ABV2L7Q6_9HYPH|nr:sigma-54 dependent transcriptional regulator [Methylobacterium goesingense]GJD72336.1 C4-dicarboxylate transport transcriptional regulatory protein DctD [Methylobacterium goesingense]